MGLIAKVRIDEVLTRGGRLYENGQDVGVGVTQEEILARAVVASGGASDENASFSKFTPYLELKMHVTNPAAFGYLEPGQEYYVEIRKARGPRVQSSNPAEVTISEQ